MVLLLFPRGPAHAEGSAAPSAVVLVAGKKGDAAAIATKLPTPWIAGDSAAFRRAVGGAKGASTLAAQAAGSKTRGRAVPRIEAAAGKAHAQAVIVVRVDAAKRARKGTWVVIGADGSVTAGNVDLGAPSGDGDAFASSVAPALGRLAPAAPTPAQAAPPASAPPASPADVASAPASPASPASPPPDTATASTDTTDAPSAVASDAPVDADHASSTEPHAPGPQIDASLGLVVGARHFAYSDPVTTNLRPYDLGAAPAARVAAGVYPFVAMRTPVLRDLGVTGDVTYAVGLTSQVGDGGSLDTSWVRYDLGVRERLPLGAGPRAPVLGIGLGYGREAFTFSGAAASTPDLPSVAYTFLRGELDARVPVGPVALLAALGYLDVLGAGDVASRVRDTKVGGIEARLGAALPIKGPFEARANAEYTRFFYRSGPVPGDAYVAGGALDQFLRGELALAYVR